MNPPNPPADDPQSQVYDSPLYYEIAFSGRNIGEEVDFMTRLAEEHGCNRFFEIASGNSPHMRELLDRGYDYTGLELSESMLDHSRDQLRPGDRAELVQGDMRDFSLSKPCDFAYLMVCSLFVADSRELNTHFDSVARSLRPGGIYLLDGCIHFRLPDGVLDWTMSRRGVRVHTTVTWKFNWVRQAFDENLVLEVSDRGRPFRCEHSSSRRALFPQEFRQYIDQRGDFEFLGWWENFDFEQPILDDGKPIMRPVVVVRRI